jgi:hypothetical protein
LLPELERHCQKTPPLGKKSYNLSIQEENPGKSMATSIFLSLNFGRWSISFPSWYNALICAETFVMSARLIIRTINKNIIKI